ncbi:MAG: hypothetical protein ABH983_04240 [Candidatus Micrarchaeota archaeon]
MVALEIFLVGKTIQDLKDAFEDAICEVERNIDNEFSPVNKGDSGFDFDFYSEDYCNNILDELQCSKEANAWINREQLLDFLILQKLEGLRRVEKIKKEQRIRKNKEEKQKS